ncbi:unnamed protein product, partial [Didymodactylos carnosus]
MIYECISKNTNYLTIVDLKANDPVEPDIDLVILKALLTASNYSEGDKNNDEYKRHKAKQFHLALLWDRIDIAKTYVMADENDWSDKSPFTSGYYYSSKVNSHNNNGDTLYGIYVRYITPLIGDFFEIDAVLQTTVVNNKRITPDENKQKWNSSTRGIMDIDKLLLLWSVLTNKHGLALLFWSRTKNKICAALIASLLYKNISANKKFLYDKLVCQELVCQAHEFEQLAINLLDLFYKHNRHECMRSVVRRIPSYGNCTWLTIAAKAKAKTFIAHGAIQDVLKDIWYGYIDHENCLLHTVVLSSFFPPLSGFLRYHTRLVYVDGPESTNEWDFESDRLMSDKQQEHRHAQTEENIGQRDAATAQKTPLLETFTVDLSIWYMRTLDIFFAVPQIGPKLVMIAKM